MLRSTEAIMAGLLIIFTLNYLFKIPEIEIQDPIEVYISSLLDAYEPIAKDLVFKDPYSLMLLLDSALPYGYSSKISINVYKKIEFFGVENLTLPFELYEILPGEVKTNLENSEIKGNWYQAKFVVENNGNESVETWQSISVALFKPDINKDNIPEPVDPESIKVFTDEGEAEYKIKSIEDYPEKIIAAIDVKIKVEPGERKNIYVLYLVGDDYE